MEGLIWNANKVLDYAMRPGLRGVHSGQFRTCAGICILSSLQVGYVVSGSVGSGIFMKHNFDDSWSNPVAVGITTVGLGVTVGATLKDALIFMTDFETVETFFKTGVRLGGRANL
jgi:lipid-binding SYLF domain-containing protein